MSVPNGISFPPTALARCTRVTDANATNKIAPNYGRFLPSQILGVWSPKKLYPNYRACLAARHVNSFVRLLPLTPTL